MIRTWFRHEYGSSPRERGKPSYVDYILRASRLIPARAGKTSRIDQLGSIDAAHPRSRGENAKLSVQELG